MFKAIILIVLLQIFSFPQSAITQPTQKAFFGIGLGLDYGGVGVRAEFQPVPQTGLFGGVGYNFVDLAYNAGASYKFLTKGKVQPIVLAMYGYNASIKLQNNPAYSTTYYGFSAGGGCELYDNQKKHKLALEVLVPFRSQEFRSRYKELRDGGASTSGVLPVTFTIGYNFYIPSRKLK